MKPVAFIVAVVAAVAAIDEETCYKAMKLIHVEYEELPAIFDPEKAMKDGAPRLFDDKYENNINTRVDHHFGDIEKGFAEADHIREARFVGNRTYQNPMEPHCAIAEWDRQGKVTLYTSTQVVHYVHHQLSRILDLPLGNILIQDLVAQIVIAAFNGHIDHETARVTQRPGNGGVHMIHPRLHHERFVDPAFISLAEFNGPFLVQGEDFIGEIEGRGVVIRDNLFHLPEYIFKPPIPDELPLPFVNLHQPLVLLDHLIVFQGAMQRRMQVVEI